MKKIFNWTFGSIFRTLGRITAYLIIAGIFGYFLSRSNIDLSNYLYKILGLDVVSATTVPEWGASNDFNSISNGFIADCTSSGCSDKNVSLQYTALNGYQDIPFIINDSALTIANNGVFVYYTPNTNFKAGYLYLVSTYICSNNIIGYSNLNSTIGNISNIKSIPSVVYQNNQWAVLNGSPGDGTNTWNNCYVFSSLVVTNTDNMYYGLKFDRSGQSSLTNTYISLFGYKVENLGVYTDTIANVVESVISRNMSGVATSAQLSSVENSINSTTEQASQDITNSVDNVNDSINDSDSSSATGEANSFFSNFTTNTHGLTGIITAPLNAINSLTSATCSPLVLPLPFINQNLTLPCMRSIYVQNFGAFMNIYDAIVLGIISYWVMVRIFALVKDFKNPDHDEIEVLDL